MTVTPQQREETIAGALLGCAIGDALGLPAEGMCPAKISQRFGALDRFHLVGRTGYVSDDTEQTALVAESMIVGRREGAFNEESALRHFRRRLLGWFFRLPFGIGLATLRACVKIMLGARTSGVHSAGNGAVMRAAIIGVALPDDPAVRRSIGRKFASVTHLDERAVQGALFIAELAAGVAGSPAADRTSAARDALDVVVEPSLRASIERAIWLGAMASEDAVAARELGTTGFVMHTVPLAVFMLVKHGGAPMPAIRATIAAGGDADSNAAVVGALVGAQHGASALPTALIDHLHDGPFGPTHLRGLADALARGKAPPQWSGAAALLRNLALYPVILAHGFRRLLPL